MAFQATRLSRPLQFKILDILLRRRCGGFSSDIAQKALQFLPQVPNTVNLLRALEKAVRRRVSLDRSSFASSLGPCTAFGSFPVSGHVLVRYQIPSLDRYIKVFFRCHTSCQRTSLFPIRQFSLRIPLVHSSPISRFAPFPSHAFSWKSYSERCLIVSYLIFLSFDSCCLSFSIGAFPSHLREIPVLPSFLF